MGCEVNNNQNGYKCESILGDGYNNKEWHSRWAYSSQVPAWIIFSLASPVRTNMIVVYSGRPSDGYGFVRFNLELKVGEEFVEPSNLRVLLDGATYKDGIIKVPDRSYEVGIIFDEIKDVTAVKINVYESDCHDRRNAIMAGIKINDWTNMTLHNPDTGDYLDIGLELEDAISTVITFNGENTQRKAVPVSIASYR